MSSLSPQPPAFWSRENMHGDAALSRWKGATGSIQPAATAANLDERLDASPNLTDVQPGSYRRLWHFEELGNSQTSGLKWYTWKADRGSGGQAHSSSVSNASIACSSVHWQRLNQSGPNRSCGSASASMGGMSGTAETA